MADLDHLFVELYPRLYGWALQKCSRPELAEDAVQDAYLKLRRGALPTVLKPGYLFSAVRSTLIDAHRKVHATVELKETTAASDPAALDALVISDERWRALGPALATLTPTQRLVVELYTIHGYRHAAIAEILGVSPQASKMQLQRARIRLRQSIDGPPAPAAPV